MCSEVFKTVRHAIKSWSGVWRFGVGRRLSRFRREARLLRICKGSWRSVCGSQWPRGRLMDLYTGRRVGLAFASFRRLVGGITR
jgi:hypothetical protein